MTLTRLTLTLSCLTPFLSCAGDRSRSPTCGMAQLIGPSLIQDRLRHLPFVLTDEPRRPPEGYPSIGALTATDRTIPLYGVRVDWANVSNPKCPLLGAPAGPASSAQ